MMDSLSFASSIVGIISTAQKATAYIAGLKNKQAGLIFEGELCILTSFLTDIKNTFLNTREEPPSTAQYALHNCDTSLKALEKVLVNNYRRDSEAKWKDQWLLRRSKQTKNESNSFRDSVLMLKDIYSL